MSRPTPMRYVIRNAKGEELVCPSLADLHALYVQGFLGDDDLVRAENSQRFVRVSAMPALRGAREQRSDPRKVATLLVAAAVLVFAVALCTGLGR
ncbi:MAG TPA: hypothetical protein VLV17_06710 [Anaeromyxobacteraceae bacterium]|nr:hypothetical protein [Anaeromyxobacteraceae bacterium]